MIRNMQLNSYTALVVAPPTRPAPTPTPKPPTTPTDLLQRYGGDFSSLPAVIDLSRPGTLTLRPLSTQAAIGAHLLLRGLVGTVPLVVAGGTPPPGMDRATQLGLVRQVAARLPGVTSVASAPMGPGGHTALFVATDGERTTKRLQSLLREQVLGDRVVIAHRQGG